MMARGGNVQRDNPIVIDIILANGVQGDRGDQVSPKQFAEISGGPAKVRQQIKQEPIFPVDVQRSLVNTTVMALDVLRQTGNVGGQVGKRGVDEVAWYQ